MDEYHATTTLPPPLQLSITVTASLFITAAHCHQSTNFSNGARIFRSNPLDEGSDYCRFCNYIGWTKMSHGHAPTPWSGLESTILKFEWPKTEGLRHLAGPISTHKEMSSYFGSAPSGWLLHDNILNAMNLKFSVKLWISDQQFCYFMLTEKVWMRRKFAFTRS
jgi:hypothetical protein